MTWADRLPEPDRDLGQIATITRPDGNKLSGLQYLLSECFGHSLKHKLNSTKETLSATGHSQFISLSSSASAVPPPVFTALCKSFRKPWKGESRMQPAPTCNPANAPYTECRPLCFSHSSIIQMHGAHQEAHMTSHLRVLYYLSA